MSGFPNSQAPLNNQVLTLLGNKTKTTILALESDRISLEFTASTAIAVGQPVKINADGTVSPWTTADKIINLVGYAYNAATGANDLLTVFVRGFILIYALSKAADAAGSAKYDSYDTTTQLSQNVPPGFNVYAKGVDGTDDLICNAFILDASTGAGNLIRVLLKN